MLGNIRKLEWGDSRYEIFDGIIDSVDGFGPNQEVIKDRNSSFRSMELQEVRCLDDVNKN